MMNPLLLFLDIDGVLNRAGQFANEPRFDTSCLLVLQRLTAAYETRIVMSTSWRASISPADFARRLSSHGITSPVIGVTPDLSSRWYDNYSICRGDEIQAWLDENSDHPYPPILVLEDHEDLGPVGIYAYYTNPSTGLTPADLAPIRKLINQQRPATCLA